MTFIAKHVSRNKNQPRCTTTICNTTAVLSHVTNHAVIDATSRWMVRSQRKSPATSLVASIPCKKASGFLNWNISSTSNSIIFGRNFLLLSSTIQGGTTWHQVSQNEGQQKHIVNPYQPYHLFFGFRTRLGTKQFYLYGWSTNPPNVPPSKIMQQGLNINKGNQ